MIVLSTLWSNILPTGLADTSVLLNRYVALIVYFVHIRGNMFDSADVKSTLDVAIVFLNSEADT
ncbi:hypothetical protein HI914_03550 [Erysiphe necator]|nr:hypothetical protein HI914_03550 [Erysiphe necator]